MGFCHIVPRAVDRQLIRSAEGRMVVTIARSGSSRLASRSHVQAKNNTTHSCTVIAIMRACGGLLLSFSQRYQQWCKRNRVTRYTILDAVRQGYGTLLDMVAAQQPNG